MFRYFKKNEKEHITLLRQNLLLSQEIEWANIFHDSTKGKPWLQNLSLNIGRWAGSYSFFYILHRILQDYKPYSILEMGLGESSKLISNYLENYLHNSQHFIIEHDNNWAKQFNEKFILSKQSTIIHCPLHVTEVNGFKTNSYLNIESKIEQKHDLYIIDGPFGSDRFSRYDMYYLAKKMLPTDEFIILFDDTNRKGEEDTINAIIEHLESQNIPIYVQSYEGVKKSTIVATTKFKFATSF